MMVVDESSGVLHSLILLLEHFGFETHGFLTQQAALAALSDYRPDVLICDAHVEEVEDQDVPLPGRIEAIETASSVQRVRPGCKVIILSSNLKPTTVEDGAHRLGMEVEVMPKPASPPELISAVRKRTG